MEECTKMQIDNKKGRNCLVGHICLYLDDYYLPGIHKRTKDRKAVKHSMMYNLCVLTYLICIDRRILIFRFS